MLPTIVGAILVAVSAAALIYFLAARKRPIFQGSVDPFGQYHGSGHLILPNGQVYEGAFSHGKYHGRGVLNGPDGRIYSGSFEHGQYSGKGKETYPDGSIYEGDFADGKRSSRKGTMTYSNGEIYTGQWKRGNRHGTGTLLFASGGRFEGSFTRGLRHGPGTIILLGGEQLQGSWRMGRMTSPLDRVSSGSDGNEDRKHSYMQAAKLLSEAPGSKSSWILDTIGEEDERLQALKTEKDLQQNRGQKSGKKAGAKGRKSTKRMSGPGPLATVTAAAGNHKAVAAVPKVEGHSAVAPNHSRSRSQQHQEAPAAAESLGTGLLAPQQQQPWTDLASLQQRQVSIAERTEELRLRKMRKLQLESEAAAAALGGSLLGQETAHPLEPQPQTQPELPVSLPPSSVSGPVATAALTVAAELARIPAKSEKPEVQQPRQKQKRQHKSRQSQPEPVVAEQISAQPEPEPEPEPTPAKPATLPEQPAEPQPAPLDSLVQQLKQVLPHATVSLGPVDKPPAPADKGAAPAPAHVPAVTSSSKRKDKQGNRKRGKQEKQDRGAVPKASVATEAAQALAEPAPSVPAALVTVSSPPQSAAEPEPEPAEPVSTAPEAIAVMPATVAVAASGIPVSEPVTAVEHPQKGDPAAAASPDSGNTKQPPQQRQQQHQQASAESKADEMPSPVAETQSDEAPEPEPEAEPDQVDAETADATAVSPLPVAAAVAVAAGQSQSAAAAPVPAVPTATPQSPDTKAEKENERAFATALKELRLRKGPIGYRLAQLRQLQSKYHMEHLNLAELGFPVPVPGAGSAPMPVPGSPLQQQASLGSPAGKTPRLVGRVNFGLNKEKEKQLQSHSPFLPQQQLQGQHSDDPFAAAETASVGSTASSEASLSREMRFLHQAVHAEYGGNAPSHSHRWTSEPDADLPHSGSGYLSVPRTGSSSKVPRSPEQPGRNQHSDKMVALTMLMLNKQKALPVPSVRSSNPANLGLVHTQRRRRGSTATQSSGGSQSPRSVSSASSQPGSAKQTEAPQGVAGSSPNPVRSRASSAQALSPSVPQLQYPQQQQQQRHSTRPVAASPFRSPRSEHGSEAEAAGYAQAQAQGQGQAQRAEQMSMPLPASPAQLAYLSLSPEQQYHLQVAMMQQQQQQQQQHLINLATPIVLTPAGYVMTGNKITPQPPTFFVPASQLRQHTAQQAQGQGQQQQLVHAQQLEQEQLQGQQRAPELSEQDSPNVAPISLPRQFQPPFHLSRPLKASGAASTQRLTTLPESLSAASGTLASVVVTPPAEEVKSTEASNSGNASQGPNSGDKDRHCDLCANLHEQQAPSSPSGSAQRCLCMCHREEAPSPQLSGQSQGPAAWSFTPNSHTQALHGEILRWSADVQVITESLRPAMQDMVKRVQSAVHALWPDVLVETYGSFVTGLNLPSSDLDLVVVGVQGNPMQAFYALADELRRKPWLVSINVIDTAMVPIIKLVAAAKRHKVLVDITFSATMATLLAPSLQQQQLEVTKRLASKDSGSTGSSGTGETKLAALPSVPSQAQSGHTGTVSAMLIKHCITCLPALRPLSLVLKQLLYERGLSDTYTGGLSSYCLGFMLVSFLQTLSQSRVPYSAAAIFKLSFGSAGNGPRTSTSGSALTLKPPAGNGNGNGNGSGSPQSPVSPSLLSLHAQASAQSDSGSGTNADSSLTQAQTQSQSQSQTQSQSQSQSQSSMSAAADDLGHLLLCFLDFYGRHLDFEQTGIALTPHIPAPGSLCFFRLNEKSSCLVIVDPFNPSNNIGKSVFGMARVKSLFRAALRSLMQPKAEERELLLGRILENSSLDITATSPSAASHT